MIRMEDLSYSGRMGKPTTETFFHRGSAIRCSQAVIFLAFLMTIGIFAVQNPGYDHRLFLGLESLPARRHCHCRCLHPRDAEWVDGNGPRAKGFPRATARTRH